MNLHSNVAQRTMSRTANPQKTPSPPAVVPRVGNSLNKDPFENKMEFADTRIDRYFLRQLILNLFTLFRYVPLNVDELKNTIDKFLVFFSNDDRIPPTDFLVKGDNFNDVLSLEHYFSFHILTKRRTHIARIVCDYHDHNLTYYTRDRFNKVRNDFLSRLNRIYSGNEEADNRYDNIYGQRVKDYYVEMPHWFFVILQSAAFANAQPEIDYEPSRSFCYPSTRYDLSPIYSWLESIDPDTFVSPKKIKLSPSLDNEIKILSLRRRMDGQRIHIDNLTRRLNSLDLNAENNADLSNDLIHDIERSKDILDTYRKNLAQYEEVLETKPCMEAPNEVTQTVDDAMNTGIADTAIEYVAEVTEQPPNMNFVEEIVTDIPHSYPDLTERWQKIKTIRLDGTTVRGTTHLLHLPADFVTTNYDSPNTLPFRAHEFFTGSMKIKLQWNLAKTNQCHLKAGYVYHLLQRDRPDELLDYAPVSQQPGGRLNGHISNSTIIDIPYMSYSTMIPTRANNALLNLYYVTLIIKFFTDFQVSTGGVSSADLIVYIKFEKDLKFFGQRKIDDVVPAWVAPVAPPEFQYHLDPEPEPEIAPPPAPEIPIPDNASRPGLILQTVPCMLAAAATSVVKTATNIGTNALSSIATSTIETANRAVLGGVKSATSKFVGATENLLSKALPPRHNRDKPSEYHNAAFHQRATTNLAGGSGEFVGESLRLETSGLTPHPDSFLGIEKFNTIESLISCFGFANAFRWSISDQAETLLAIIRIQPGRDRFMRFGNLLPNTGLTEWAPLDHFAGWFMNYHGVIQLKFEFVSDGFKTGRLLFAYVPNATEPLDYASARAAYFKTFDMGADLDTQQTFTFDVPYIHNFANMPNRVGDNGIGMSAGQVYVFVESAITMPQNLVQTVDVLVSKRAKPGSFVFAVPRENMSAIKQNNNTPFTELDTRISFITTVVTWAPRVINIQPFVNGFPLAVIDFSTIGEFENIIIPDVTGVARSRTDSQLVWHQNVTNNRSFFVRIEAFADYPSDGVSSLNFFLRGTISYDTGREYIFLPFGEEPTETVYAFSRIAAVPPVLFTTPCMDVRFDPVDDQSTVPELTTLTGALVGEDHMNLQNNLRRFENFWTRVLKVPPGSLTGVLRLPIHYGAPNSRDQLASAYASNKILHLHDAMRFARGGLRYYIELLPDVDGVLRLVHEPQTQNYIFGPADQLATFPYEPGYAETVLSLNQNKTIAVEMPFYNPNLATLNSSYLSNELSTNLSQGLGTLKMYWTGEEGRIRCNISRAFADDTQFYGFTGFPTRRLNLTAGGNNIPFYPVPEILMTTPCMFTSTTAKVEMASEAITEAANSLTNFLESMTVSGAPREIISTLLLQAGHILATPTFTHFACGVGQILVTLKIVKLEILSQMQKCLTDIWDFLTGDGLLRTIPAIGGSISEDIDSFSRFSSFIWTGLSTLFNLSPAQRNQTAFERINLAFNKSPIQHRISEFIKIMLTYIKDCAIWICARFWPESKLYEYLTDDSILEWSRKAILFTDDTVFSRIEQSPKMIAALFKTIDDGNNFMETLIRSKSMNVQLINSIKRHLDSLIKIRARLAPLADVPTVYYNPFCYYLHGDTSIGKSYILKEISIQIISKEIGRAHV